MNLTITVDCHPLLEISTFVSLHAGLPISLVDDEEGASVEDVALA
jgi:hypothetical protein